MKKELKPAEILVLLQNGFAIFPIWQMSGNSAASFSYEIGKEHGAAAHAAAARLLFPKGTAIYFAVDYDADQNDITLAIIPYFRGSSGALLGRGTGTVTVSTARETCASTCLAKRPLDGAMSQACPPGILAILASPYPRTGL